MDWLACTDTLLCGRLTHCTACGKPAARVWANSWNVGMHTVAIAICDRCQTTTDWQATLRRVMSERYREDRYGH